MSSFAELTERFITIESNVKQMASELMNLKTISNENNKQSGSWKELVKDKLFEIKNDIESLHDCQKRLENKKVSLQKEIENLNHQIDKMSKTNKSTKTEQKLERVKPKQKRTVYHQNEIPDWVTNNKELNDAMKRGLPSNYNFEIYKTLWRISLCQEPQCKRIGLQFPEGLLIYSCIIADIIERFMKLLFNLDVECIILGDVTYGACCIDDYTSFALKCDFLIHYGHSCLIPINNMNDKYYKRILYVFVQIGINQSHLVSTIRLNFNPLNEYKDKKIVIAGTIQFVNILQNIKQQLCDLHEYKSENIIIPQAKPLSPAEVLGCTSPDLNEQFGDDIDCCLFISDGRFHLESIMIANPQIAKRNGFFKYNPYDNKITKESYNTQLMHKIRYNAIEIAQKNYDKTWCIILSTLGRQGNVNILNRIQKLMDEKNIKYISVLLSEIYSDKLKKFNLKQIQCFIQIGCPRLSIDWGADILNEVPILNAYEATVALKHIEWKNVYPMDYYRKDGGVWSNYYMTEQERKQKEIERKERRKQLRRQRLLNKNKKTNHIVLEYQQ